jgi:hypothetical protein
MATAIILTVVQVHPGLEGKILTASIATALVLQGNGAAVEKTHNLRLSLLNPPLHDTAWATADWALRDVTFQDLKKHVEAHFETHRNDFAFFSKYRDEQLKKKSVAGQFAAAYASICFTGHQKGLRPSYRYATGMLQLYIEPYLWIASDMKIPLSKEIVWLRIVLQPMTDAWQGGTYLAAKRYLKSFPNDELVRSKYYWTMSNVLVAPKFDYGDKDIIVPDIELKEALATSLKRANLNPKNSMMVGSAATLFSIAGLVKKQKGWYSQGIALHKLAYSIPCLDEFDKKANEPYALAIKEQESYLRKHF